MRPSSKRNVFLIGMMGSGKSTVGRRLAETLDMSFVDIDTVLEISTEMLISEIFEKYGEKRFRELEGAYFRERAGLNNQVFSMGGGIILGKESRELLRNRGFTVLLRVKPRTLIKRIRSTSSRPLLHNAQNTEARLAEIWNERKEYYEASAHLIIDADNLSRDTVVNMIADRLRKTNEDN